MKLKLKWIKPTVKEYVIELPEGLSYRRLAKLTGVSKTYWVNILKDDRAVSEDVAAKIVKAFKKIS